MKKVFISVPMKGRTDEAIKNSIERMHKIAELAFGEELEPIHNHFDYEVPEGTNRSIYCLGHAIQKMADADYFIGITFNPKYKGCEIENNVAANYNIPRYYVDFTKVGFFKDCYGHLEKRGEENEENSYIRWC